jgi:elongation factor 1-alpha
MSTKLITFIDIGGHEKYAKLIMSGLCSHYPDYLLFIVSARQGISKRFSEYLRLSAIFNVPIITVLTQIDAATPIQIEEIEKELSQRMKSPPLEKRLLSVKTIDDVVLYSRTLHENIVPVFLVRLPWPFYLTCSDLQCHRSKFTLVPNIPQSLACER